MAMCFRGARGVVREDRATRIIFREMGWGGTRWVVSCFVRLFVFVIVGVFSCVFVLCFFFD